MNKDIATIQKFLKHLGFTYNSKLDTWDNYKEKLRLTCEFCYRDAIHFPDTHKYTEDNIKYIFECLHNCKDKNNGISTINDICTCDMQTLILQGCICKKEFEMTFV